MKPRQPEPVPSKADSFEISGGQRWLISQKTFDPEEIKRDEILEAVDRQIDSAMMEPKYHMRSLEVVVTVVALPYPKP